MLSRYRPAVVLWTVFLVLLVAGGWYKSVENSSDWERQVAWQAHMSQLQAESRQELARLDAFFESDRASPLTRADLERELNDGQPLDLEESRGRLMVDWTHPKYNIPVRLYFDGDQFEGWRMSGGSPEELPGNAKPPRTSHSSTAERIRKRIPGIATVVWVAAAVVACVGRRDAVLWPAAQVMLAASLAFGAATVVSPNYNLTVEGIFSNDPMFLAVIMYVLSLFALAIHWPDGLPTFHFKLGHLLLIFTGVAVLLAAGPFGYFAICVFAAGGVLFWLLLAFRQPQVENPQA
ncbi:hypothetical protein NG895_11125 [Aeoliella sp. ICT_H6.2]|uniref:Uncharacterized protein n=1 Tax=Aeoliella straminimaris TaxID=2954799 RepID=A0A9X2JG75_9BACT|nr:hypothetical protein [Aeoliella straminimaris]MCO6044456.1 hypothetical protein [Aeoliella straminimaris]